MKIFFDGACRPNPGPIHVAAVIGADVHVRTDIAVGDNNQAEWLALLHALDLAIAAGAGEAVIVGDSALVIGQASGRRPCRSAQLRPYLRTFRERSVAVPALKLRQVPRSRNLAGIVLDAQRNRALTP